MYKTEIFILMISRITVSTWGIIYFNWRRMISVYKQIVIIITIIFTQCSAWLRKIELSIISISLLVNSPL